MIKAILMDFNGVIINDEPIQMQVYRDLLAPEEWGAFVEFDEGLRFGTGHLGIFGAKVWLGCVFGRM